MHAGVICLVVSIIEGSDRPYSTVEYGPFVSTEVMELEGFMIHGGECRWSGHSSYPAYERGNIRRVYLKSLPSVLRVIETLVKVQLSNNEIRLLINMNNVLPVRPCLHGGKGTMRGELLRRCFDLFRSEQHDASEDNRIRTSSKVIYGGGTGSLQVSSRIGGQKWPEHKAPRNRTSSRDRPFRTPDGFVMNVCRM